MASETLSRAFTVPRQLTAGLHQSHSALSSSARKRTSPNPSELIHSTNTSKLNQGKRTSPNPSELIHSTNTSKLNQGKRTSPNPSKLYP